MAAPTRVAFVGTGNIAGPYAASVGAHPDLELVGVLDVAADKATEFAAAHGVVAYADLDALGAAQPDIVVNLTSAPHHYATTKELIARGHTVFSEKPLALTHAEASELVELAESAGTRLSCAPSIWLGAATMEAARLVRAGTVGDVRLVTAEVNQGRIESWHPAPHTFYQVGPVFDAGVYPLAYLTAVLGPIVEVTAVAGELLPNRTTLANEAFTIPTGDGWVVMARFATGALLRLTCTFFVDSAVVPRAIDFHGVDGTLRLDDWLRSDSPIRSAPFGQPLTELVPGDGVADVDWSLGLAELAAAMRENRPHRVSASHAAHVVDVLQAVSTSAAEGVRVPVSSAFPSPFDTSDDPVAAARTAL